MRGKRAKQLRKASKLNLNEWKRLHPRDKYRIQTHTKQVWNVEIVDSKPKSVPTDVQKVQVYTRGDKATYRTLKNIYKSLGGV